MARLPQGGSLFRFRQKKTPDYSEVFLSCFVLVGSHLCFQLRYAQLDAIPTRHHAVKFILGVNPQEYTDSIAAAILPLHICETHVASMQSAQKLSYSNARLISREYNRLPKLGVNRNSVVSVHFVLSFGSKFCQVRFKPFKLPGRASDGFVNCLGPVCGLERLTACG